MEIAVFSDSHGELWAMWKALEAAKAYAGITAAFHLGDGVGDSKLLSGFFENVYAVCGNCDFSTIYPLELEKQIGGVKVIASHGHRFGVKNGIGVYADYSAGRGACIALFGHTHAPMIKRREGVLLVNPGSVAYPRGSFATFAVLTVDEDKINAKIIQI